MYRKVNAWWLVIVIVVCSPRTGIAQSRNSSVDKRKTTDKSNKVMLPSEKAMPVKVPRFDRPPVIDGKLNDAVWQQAVKLKDFYQTSPGDNIAASQPTEVFLGYDSNDLYVAFHCYDDPAKVRANVAKRDDIFNDDYVGMLLDTFNDQRKAYELDFNPLGVQQDGIWQDPIFNEDFNPDFVMQSKGTLTADGYTVEVAVPFKSLRYEAGKNRNWGVHFYRRIKRINNEFDSWMPIDRAQSGWMSQAGHLAGLDGISTERTIELNPSLTVSETGTRNGTLTPAQIAAGVFDLPGRFINAPVKSSLGLTGKYNLDPNITLDFALNPDFAQVEADEVVVTANQRFPIFFPEKRPFFLEGTDIFATPVTAVNTRSIIDPDVAVKLSGKRGRDSFGILAASDNGPGELSEADRAFISESPSFILGTSNSTATDVAAVQTKQAQLAHIADKNALIGIVRLKRDVLTGQSYLGFLGTSYNFAGTNSQLAGVDGLISINRQTTFTWQALGSTSVDDFFFSDTGQTQHKRENGFGYAFDYNRNGRHLVLDLSGIGRTLFFRTAVGFQTRVNYNRESLLVQYTTEPRPKGRLISFQIYDNPSILYDWQGRVRLSNNEIQASLNLRRQAQVGGGIDNGYERLLEEEFGAKRQPGVNCVLTNNCTFAGNSERSTYNSKFYAFGRVTPNKTLRLFFIARTLQNSFDLDFGAGPRYPRVSPTALATARATQAGLCDVATPPAVCNTPLDPGPGSVFSMNTNIDFQPTTSLNLNVDFTKQRLRRNDTGLLAFDENLLTFRTTYQFTRFVFVRGRIDFDSLKSNAKGQFLFGWTPNPGTAIYVGYNDDVNRRGFNPFSGQLEPGLHRNDRTFFIKMSYLIRRGRGA